MSSEHDEIGEPLDEASKKSDVEESDSVSPKNNKASAEHAKTGRKGRGGKNRKHRKESEELRAGRSGADQLRSDVCESAERSEGNSEDASVSESDQAKSRSSLETERSIDTDYSWDSNEEFETNELEVYSGQIIRPINAPHAPKNSTQFIIDDHNECRLYMSFETPNPYLTSDVTVEGKDCVVTEPIGRDAAYFDIDYQYESPQDFDNSAYYDREFELSYKSNRFEELLRLPREDLITGIKELESRLKDLSDDLVKENPSPILEKLQHELLELQEKNCELKEEHTKLRTLLMQNEKTAERWAEISKDDNDPLMDITDDCVHDSLHDMEPVEKTENGLQTTECMPSIESQGVSPGKQVVRKDSESTENNGLSPLRLQVESEEMLTATV